MLGRWPRSDAVGAVADSSRCSGRNVGDVVQGDGVAQSLHSQEETFRINARQVRVLEVHGLVVSGAHCGVHVGELLHGVGTEVGAGTG